MAKAKKKSTTKQPDEQEGPSSKIRFADVGGQIVTLRQVHLVEGHAPSPNVTLLMAGLSKPRHKRKREPNRKILERLFPPDGMPSPEVRPAHIKEAYREECNRIGLPES